MAAFVFNISKGRWGRYGDLPEASDALIAVLLQSAGLETDAVLRDYDTLAAILAAANDEATFAGYSRQTLTTVTVAVDDGTDTVTLDFDNPSWSPTAAQNLGKILICYDNDTGAGDDTNIVPIFADDFVLGTPTSGTITYVVATGGIISGS